MAALHPETPFSTNAWRPCPKPAWGDPLPVEPSSMHASIGGAPHACALPQLCRRACHVAVAAIVPTSRIGRGVVRLGKQWVIAAGRVVSSGARYEVGARRSAHGSSEGLRQRLFHPRRAQHFITRNGRARTREDPMSWRHFMPRRHSRPTLGGHVRRRLGAIRCRWSPPRCMHQPVTGQHAHTTLGSADSHADTREKTFAALIEN